MYLDATAAVDATTLPSASSKASSGDRGLAAEAVSL